MQSSLSIGFHWTLTTQYVEYIFQSTIQLCFSESLLLSLCKTAQLFPHNDVLYLKGDDESSSAVLYHRWSPLLLFLMESLLENLPLWDPTCNWLVVRDGRMDSLKAARQLERRMAPQRGGRRRKRSLFFFLSPRRQNTGEPQSKLPHGREAWQNHGRERENLEGCTCEEKQAGNPKLATSCVWD